MPGLDKCNSLIVSVREAQEREIVIQAQQILFALMSVMSLYSTSRLMREHHLASQWFAEANLPKFPVELDVSKLTILKPDAPVLDLASFSVNLSGTPRADLPVGGCSMMVSTRAERRLDLLRLQEGHGVGLLFGQAGFFDCQSKYINLQDLVNNDPGLCDGDRPLSPGPDGDIFAVENLGFS